MHGRGIPSWVAIAASLALLAGCTAPAPAPAGDSPAVPAESTVPGQEPAPGQQPEPGTPDPTGEDQGSSDSPGKSGAPGASSPDAAENSPGSGGDPGTAPEQSPPSSPPSTGDSGQAHDDEPGSTPPAAPGPAIVITTMSCNGTGDNQKLRVQLTASYNTKYRKGITWVRFTRPDNRGSGWISQTDAEWAGQYAGKGDRWSGELPSRTPSKDNYGYGQDYGKILKLRVRTDDGTIWEKEYRIDRNC